MSMHQVLTAMLAAVLAPHADLLRASSQIPLPQKSANQSSHFASCLYLKNPIYIGSLFSDSKEWKSWEIFNMNLSKTRTSSPLGQLHCM